MARTRGTATDVPASRIDYEQTAVSRFQHIGRMKVIVAVGYEIAALQLERRALVHQHMPTHLAGIELCREQIASPLRGRTYTAIYGDATERDGREYRHRLYLLSDEWRRILI